MPHANIALKKADDTQCGKSNRINAGSQQILPNHDYIIKRFLQSYFNSVHGTSRSIRIFLCPQFINR